MDDRQLATPIRATPAPLPAEERSAGGLRSTDRGGHDDALYPGETVRTGRTLFRANWPSYAEQRLALATLRSPDGYAGPVSFEVD